MRQVILPRLAAPPGDPSPGGTTTRAVQFPHKSPHKSQSGNSCLEAENLSFFGKSYFFILKFCFRKAELKNELIFITYII